MKQLIDKDALVAEIEKIIEEQAPSHDQQCPWEDGYYCGLYKAESIIDTFETKEVDLVKEIKKYKDIHGLHTQDGGRIVFANGDTPNFLCDFRDIAKHFFELGLKEQKGWSPKNAIAIEGICSDKDFIDTNHGILAFGEEEGSYRPFNDGDKVKIIIIRKELL